MIRPLLNFCHMHTKICGHQAITNPNVDLGAAWITTSAEHRAGPPALGIPFVESLYAPTPPPGRP